MYAFLWDAWRRYSRAKSGKCSHRPWMFSACLLPHLLIWTWGAGHRKDSRIIRVLADRSRGVTQRPVNLCQNSHLGYISKVEGVERKARPQKCRWRTARFRTAIIQFEKWMEALSCRVLKRCGEWHTLTSVSGATLMIIYEKCAAEEAGMCNVCGPSVKGL